MCTRASRLTLPLVVLAFVRVNAATVGPDDLAQRYQDSLLLTSEDYQTVDVTASVFHDHLRTQLSRAVRNAKSFSYELRGVPAYFEEKGSANTAEERALRKSNNRFQDFFSNTLPLLAYAYQTPGPQPEDNPYYRSDEVLRLYLNGLDYCYSRGLTEDAWIIGNGGRVSARALRQGFVRTSGDFSTVILHMGGFIQSIFLMREPLAHNGLLDKYRAVARNLSVNNGALYPAFYEIARADAAVSHTTPLPINQRNHFSADGIRLFVDYFVPYYLLIEDSQERDEMTAILMEVIAANVAITPGVQGSIKPDGTGFHHSGAYLGSYSPYALESMAQLLYLLRGTGYYRPENVDALKLALESFRVMVQRYTMSSAYRGRLIKGGTNAAAVAVAKSMAFVAHPEGSDDPDMKARFAEFFDPVHFLDGGRLASLYRGRRGVSIRGLGIYRVIAGLQGLNTQSPGAPAGAWIKPYAVGGFFRREDWLVTAKGFSQYFWNYEGPLDKEQNSFGQNWAYGLLQVFSAGSPISEGGSGYDYFNGWDWYHVPGTTASHYPIEERTVRAVRQAREQDGVVQRTLHRNYSSKTFVGGVSIGDHGLFVHDLEAVPFTSQTNLTARKSYFFVGDKVLALGTHIQGGTEHDETHTTIFQTRLASADAPTSVNGVQVTGLEASIQQPAGSAVTMTDSVGNSYYLANSTAELFISRKLQSSLTPDHKPTEGEFVQAYLNHGIKPQGDTYQYVVIPADPDGLKLQALTSDPSDYYRVIEHEGIHLVEFPEHGITGYAFYDLVETPQDQVVLGVDLAAAVMTQEDSEGFTLAVSVPDIGWTFGPDIVTRGLSAANRYFKRQESKEHRLHIRLRGSWRLAEEREGVSIRRTGTATILALKCRDGLSNRLSLTPYN